MIDKLRARWLVMNAQEKQFALLGAFYALVFLFSSRPFSGRRLSGASSMDAKIVLVIAGIAGLALYAGYQAGDEDRARLETLLDAYAVIQSHGEDGHE